MHGTTGVTIKEPLIAHVHVFFFFFIFIHRISSKQPSINILRHLKIPVRSMHYSMLLILGGSNFKYRTSIFFCFLVPENSSVSKNTFEIVAFDGSFSKVMCWGGPVIVESSSQCQRHLWTWGSCPEKQILGIQFTTFWNLTIYFHIYQVDFFQRNRGSHVSDFSMHANLLRHFTCLKNKKFRILKEISYLFFWEQIWVKWGAKCTAK